MKTIKTAFTASGVSLIALMSAYPGLAFAQSSYAQQNRSSYHFNIPAKPLLTALADFTATTGIQVVRRNGGAISGQSAAVIGRQSPEAALSRMLGQSKLRYLFVDNHTISLYAPDEQPAPAKGVNAEGVTQLDMITITAPNGQIENASAVYSAPKSSVYISSEAIDRFSHRTAADMLKGQPGVQVGDSRNGGGGLDVNIRGIQGQSRIAVTVDGAQQALDTYRGYAGTQQRSYIDPDLIGNVLIEKGPRFAAGAPGGIGGTVAMQTIGVADILKDGKSFGIRLKGEFSDNGISPQGPRTDGHPLWKHFVKARDNRGNIFNSDAKSGSAALAYSNEYVDFVAAYAKRNDGNYFAGKHGRDRYRIYKWWTSRFGTTSRTEQESVAKAYKEGEEVMNTSSNTESVLLKATFRPTDEQIIDIGYRHFNGRFGEIMPSTIARDKDWIEQWPLGSMKIHTLTARYAYNPTDNDLINFSANAWMTDANSELLNGGPFIPVSQRSDFDPDYGWARQHNRRWGIDASNRAEFDTNLGKATLDLGVSYTNETIRPATGVIITDEDRKKGRVLRDGDRQESSVSGLFTLQPIDGFSVRMGGRFTSFDSRDHNNRWKLDEKLTRSDSGFAPVFGVSYNLTENSLLYANYTEALRMPSLFESTSGTFGVVQITSLKPERSRSWELGASTMQSDIIFTGDTGALKLAYFNTDIKDYITRYFNPITYGMMQIRNAGNFKVSGLELQANYDQGRFFTDLSTTYYLNAKTCDPAFAAQLRAGANFYLPTENTPDCTPGGFSGSYANTQNPPKYAINLTAGMRFFDEKLTVGGLMTYTSGPTEKLNKPWQKGRTADQIYYHPVAVFDAFTSYKLREDAVLNLSVENLTDRYYLDPLAQSHMPAPGRTVRAGLSMKF